LSGLEEGEEVQRIAVAGGVQLGGPARPRAGCQLGGQDLDARLLGEGAEVHAQHRTQVDTPGERGVQGGRGLAVATGHDDHDGGVRGMADEVVEEFQGRGVRPVQIVQRHDEPGAGAGPRDAYEQLRDGALQPEPVAARVLGTRIRQLHVVVGECVAERLVRDVLFVLAGPAAQYRQPPGLRPSAELGHQPALADARGPGEVHDGAIAVLAECPVEHRVQKFQLCRPAHQRSHIAT
jgi:hypothetical protein